MPWIGLRATERREWKWIDGTKTSFFDWSLNEPNNAMQSEDCVQYNIFKLWNDQGCNKEFVFICEGNIYSLRQKYKELNI